MSIYNFIKIYISGRDCESFQRENVNYAKMLFELKQIVIKIIICCKNKSGSSRAII